MTAITAPMRITRFAADFMFSLTFTGALARSSERAQVLALEPSLTVGLMPVYSPRYRISSPARICAARNYAGLRVINDHGRR